jgi:hypothetical protein
MPCPSPTEPRSRCRDKAAYHRQRDDRIQGATPVIFQVRPTGHRSIAGVVSSTAFTGNLETCNFDGDVIVEPEKLVTEVSVEVAKTATNRVFNGLALICRPAAEELGQYFGDRMRAWRANNAVRIIEDTRAIIERIEPRLSAQPRIVARVLEDGSWTDDETLQSLWAGLLATSCTAEGGTDENLLFFDLLKNLTIGQARIVENVCMALGASAARA